MSSSFHIKSKFRRSHCSQLSISSNGIWKLFCVQARRWCLYCFLITGDESGEKCPLHLNDQLDEWVLGLWTHETARASPAISRVPFRFSSSRSQLFPSLLVSTQDQPESQVFSRLAWSSYIQAFSAYLLDLTVIGCKWVGSGLNVKPVALLTWVLRPVK